jgi:hypothetical protein
MHYRIAEVSVTPGKSGVRAFCMDETGSLWFDRDGSADKGLDYLLTLKGLFIGHTANRMS